MLTFELVRIDEINQEIGKNDIQEYKNSRMTTSPFLKFNNDEKGDNDNKLLLDKIKEENNDYADTDYHLSQPLTVQDDNKNISTEDNTKKIRMKIKILTKRIRMILKIKNILK